MTVDVDAPVPDVATGGATHLHVTACSGGRPVGTLVLAAPFDPYPGRYLADAIGRSLGPDVLATRLRSAWDDDLRPPSRALAATVVVCSADRPEALRHCLASLGRLTHRVHELIVIDNSTRRWSETEVVVRDASARYVREEVPGLDRARNRALAEVGTELVLFTDDDVEVAPGWAAALIECFGDALVVAASGLVLPACLESAAERRAEAVASHGRGLHRRVVDGSCVSPMMAGSMGAGASMAFRRSFLRAIGGFPEELDAGTPTRSGGDHYAFRRVLRAGYRIVYEPSAIAYHWHREGDDAVLAAARGYGTGTSSLLLHSALRDRDVSAVTEGAPAIARYLVGKLARSIRRQHEWATIRAVAGELAGTAQGPAAYRAARRNVRVRAAVRLSRDQPAAPWLEGLRNTKLPARPAEVPSLSVVIATRGRRDRLVRLLRAIDEQEYPDDRLQIIVAIDGDIDGSADAVRSAGLRRRPRIVMLDPPGLSSDHGSGAGTARNRGAGEAHGHVLLFLDDDVTPIHSSLLLAHAATHARASAPTAAVGALAVDLRAADGYFAQRVRNWWVDQHARLAASDALSFTDVSSGNLSLPRPLFESIGGFAALPRREDWEIGWRLARAGASIRWLAAGGVVQEADLRVGNALDDRRREGHGDVLLARRHPAAFHLLRLASWLDLAPRSRLAIRSLLDRRSHSRPRTGERALHALERAGRKADYSALLDALSTWSYWLGVADAVEGQRGWTDLVSTSIATAAGPYPRVDLEHPCSLAAVLATGATEVEIVFRDITLGRAPLRWGGAPFSSSTFVQRALEQFTPSAVTVAGARSVAGGYPPNAHADGPEDHGGVAGGSDVADPSRHTMAVRHR